MRKIVILVVVVLTVAAGAFIYTQSDKKEWEKQKEAILYRRADYKMLEHSIHMSVFRSDSLLKVIEAMTTQKETAAKMKLYYPKAQLIKVLANDAVIEIDRVRIRLLSAATSKGDSVDKATVQKVMIYDSAGQKLFAIVTNYVDAFLNIDAQIERNFHDYMFVVKDTHLHSADTWTAANFKGRTLLEAMVVLQQLEADVRLDETDGIAYQIGRTVRDKVEYDKK